jgi:hypothetical protein
VEPVTLARALGWFSLGLGLVELVAGESVNRWVGTRAPPALTRAFGLREIGVGVGLLTASRLAPWMWGRVAGDALDLLALATTLEPGGERRNQAGATLALVGGITLLDMVCARELSRRAL